MMIVEDQIGLPVVVADAFVARLANAATYRRDGVEGVMVDVDARQYPGANRLWVTAAQIAAAIGA